MQPKDQHNARQAGQFHLESRQLSRRMRQLLPERLQMIDREYREKHSAARSLRLALLDNRWIAHVDEYLERQRDSDEAKILWQVGCMQAAAEKSINSWHRAIREKPMTRSKPSMKP